MVPLGFYNLVGISLIAFDNIENDEVNVKTTDIADSTNPEDFDSELANPDTDSTLFSIESYN